MVRVTGISVFSTEMSVEKRWRMIYTLCASSFFVGCSMEVVEPFLPRMAIQKDNTATQYGLSLGVCDLVCFLGCTFFAPKLQRWMTYKNALILGHALDGIFFSALGFYQFCPSGLPFFVANFATRIGQATGICLEFTAIYALLGHIFADKVESLVPIIDTCFGIGTIVGPMIAGLLFQAYGYYAIFLTFGSILLIMSIVIHSSLSVNEEIRPTRSTTNSVSTWDLKMCFIVSGISLAYALNAMHLTTFSTKLSEFQLKPVSVGAIYAVTAFSYSSSCFIAGKTSEDVHQTKTVSRIGWFLGIVGNSFIGPFVLFNFTPPLQLIVCCTISIGISYGFCAVTGFLTCSRYFIDEKGHKDCPETYAILTGIYNSAFFFGEFVGCTTGGILLDLVGYQKQTSIAASFCCFYLFIGLVMFRRYGLVRVQVNV